MATRLTRDCQKWEYLQELKFDGAIEGGTPIHMHFRIRILEGLDGTRMEFSGWQKKDGREVNKLKGRARMNRDGYGGEATFQHPQETVWSLPLPTQLPIAARREFLNALARDRKDPQSIAFEVQGISEVTRINPGKGISPAATETEGADLLKARSWAVDRAIYFEEIARNEPFMFETHQIHANGVVSKFWQDYQVMALSGDLVALKELPVPDC